MQAWHVVGRTTGLNCVQKLPSCMRSRMRPTVLPCVKTGIVGAHAAGTLVVSLLTALMKSGEGKQVHFCDAVLLPHDSLILLTGVVGQNLMLRIRCPLAHCTLLQQHKCNEVIPITIPVITSNN